MERQKVTTTRLHRTATGTALAVATGLALFSLPASPAQAMSVHDGWCVKNTGLAVVVDFSHAKASLWPNSRGYVVKCIVNPNITGGRSAALDLTGIPHVTGTDDEVRSIFGLTKNEQVYGWVHGTNKSGQLAWTNTDMSRPNPQVNGFEFWLAASSSYDWNSLPAVQPQFASAGGNNSGGGGSDGSLNPGAPKQTYNPKSGTGGGAGKGNGNKTNSGAVQGPGGNGGGTGGNGGSNGSGTGGRSGTSGGNGSGGSGSGNGGGGTGNGARAQQSAAAAAKAKAQASAKAKAKSSSAKPSGSASPTPNASASASAAVSPVYAAESPKGSAAEAANGKDNKNWMWAGIGLGAVIVAAAVTAGIQGVSTRKKKNGPTPPSAKR
jgi:hypothetical protein